MDASELDARILAIGREIFTRVERSSFRGPIRRADDALFNLTMRDEGVKSQLFRFVDALPALRSPQAVARSVREYLALASPYLKPVLGEILDWAVHQKSLESAIAAAANFNARRMGRRFIAAGDLSEAHKAIADLRRRRLGFTIDLLGEAVVSEAEAEQYQRQYLELLSSLPSRVAAMPPVDLIDRDSHGPIPRVNLSLKLSSLYSQFDPIDPQGTTAAVLDRLRPILRAARQQGVFVNLDMEQSSFKSLTIRIFKTILSEPEFRDWPDVGIAIQAYLRAAAADLADLADWARQRGTSVWVRLVKGAYWDSEMIVAAQNGWPEPVFLDKAATDANFESCSHFLIENHQWLRPAIASHNIRSIAAAMAQAERAGLNSRDIEFQMLYGMAEEIKSALVLMGRRVRVYAPMGKLLPGMAYLVRRLLENTSNESFLRAGFIEHVPQEQLLMNPVMKIRSTAPAGKTAEYDNEPPTDFSLEPSRQAMADALAQAAEKKREHPLIIGGETIFTSHWIESVNPSHKSQIVGRVASAGPQEANAAITMAGRAFESWRNTSPDDRAALLDRVADVLHRKRFALAALEVLECAKPWREADNDIAEAIDFCRYYAWQMRTLARPQGKDIPGETNAWLYEPRGVAVVIAPWNFPLAILCGMATAAVVAGNPVILKPAEQSPLIAWELAKAFEEAGAPPGVVNYLPGIGEEIGPILVEHPEVALIAFTGSRAVGLGINASAAKTRDDQDHLKRVIVEMGGKNAIIVDQDADLDDAVAGVAASAFGYSGQKCSACSRVVVLAEIHDAFLARLIEATASLKIAPAEDPACRIGPVIDPDAVSRITAAVQRGKQEARLAWIGDCGPLTDEGFFVPPAIFSNVDPRSALAQEEIFGPVLSVMKANDLDQALSIANGVRYALTGGVYSRSPANIDRCRREFRVGNLYINRRITGALVGRQPFGGFKLSGGGTQAGGPDYLRHFMLPRCITENTVRHGFAPTPPREAR